MMELTIAYSPCPNDTFIFDALVNSKIDCGNYHFIPQLMDVELLNKAAQTNTYNISKLSYGAMPSLIYKYQILTSGSALGWHCGPLLVAKKQLNLQDLSNVKVAIPGFQTTANLLLSIFYPSITQKKEMLFSSIEDAVANEEIEAGLIIHESRFTYHQKGLYQVADLGDLWSQKFNVPIPLGCIAVQNNLPEKVKLDVQELVKKSVQFAFDHPESSAQYVQFHANDMNPEVQKKHIELYVNNFSLDLGVNGLAAVNLLLDVACKSNQHELINKNIFLKV